MTHDLEIAQASAEVVELVAARPEGIAEMLSRLGQAVLDEDALEDYLQRLVDVVARTVEGCDAAGVTLRASGRWLTAAYTDATTLAVDRDQYAAGEGPCLDAAEHAVVNLVDVAEAADRWPAFAAAARSEGIRSFLAAPLSGPELPVGALNLYSRAAQGFDRIDRAYVELMARYAADAVASVRRVSDARRLADQLEEAMASRAVIEQAKGILMALHGVDESEAFLLLRDESQRRNVKLRLVAADFVERARTTAVRSGGAMADYAG